MIVWLAVQVIDAPGARRRPPLAGVQTRLPTFGSVTITLCERHVAVVGRDDRVVDDVADGVVAGLGRVLGDGEMRGLVPGRGDVVTRLGGTARAVIDAGGVDEGAGVEVGLGDRVAGRAGDRRARGQAATGSAGMQTRLLDARRR